MDYNLTVFPNICEEHLRNCLKTLSIASNWFENWWYTFANRDNKVLRQKYSMTHIFENLSNLEKNDQNVTFFLHLIGNQAPNGSLVKLHYQIIFSCLRINSITAEILKSIPLLSSIKYKNDSLCLYTLYESYNGT